ncbi:single-stranded DNA-binding protein [Streptomyces sp. NPDC094468]|uniref:single-stranded DNA-binding protein n=1 Tax=Streptomyces sp. NPDC094468 TaxID=3366066 RepID=UPI00380E2644
MNAAVFQFRCRNVGGGDYSERESWMIWWEWWVVAGETLATVVGNLTADPELRFTASGVPVAGFTVASTPRTFDRERSEWVDGEPLFLRCSLWRQAAENAANSLAKGARVIVTGRLKQRTFDDNEGQRRTVVEMDAEEIAVSLAYATASVTKTYRSGGNAASAPAPRQQPQQSSAEAEPHPF